MGKAKVQRYHSYSFLLRTGRGWLVVGLNANQAIVHRYLLLAFRAKQAAYDWIVCHDRDHDKVGTLWQTGAAHEGGFARFWCVEVYDVAHDLNSCLV